MGRKGWSTDELEIMKKYYPTEGIGVKARLPERTDSQIYGVAWHYGIKNCSRKKRSQNTFPRRKYTEYEKDYIARHIEKDGVEAVAEALGRSPDAIRSAMSKHSLSPKNTHGQLPWTKEEIAIMKRYFPKEGIAVKKRLADRTTAAIYSEASHLGISHGKRTKRSNNSTWTKEEDAIITSLYVEKGVQACMEQLPGRSQQAIIMRANRHLNLKRRKPDKGG